MDVPFLQPHSTLRVQNPTRQRIGFGWVGLCVGGDIKGEGRALAIKGQQDGRGANSDQLLTVG